MIGSGWKIYNDDAIFGALHFPDSLVIGKWAQHGLQWHFFGMWIFVFNGLAYLTYGVATGRFRRKLFPISIREILVTVGEALRFRLGHDDLTHYNAVQKILYLGVILIGICIVISGLALWKPVQFSELAALFGIDVGQQRIRRLPLDRGRPRLEFREQAPALAVAGQVVERQVGGDGFQPAARGCTGAQLMEMLVGAQKHLLREVFGLGVVAREARSGRKDHVLIGAHEGQEFGRGGSGELRWHWIAFV